MLQRSIFSILLLIVPLFLFEGCGNTSSTTTLYEDAEDGTTSKWEVLEGPYEVLNREGGANGSKRAIFLRQNWHNAEDGHRISGVLYRLTNKEHTPWHNTKEHILELDHKKVLSDDGFSYCFTIGVEANTTKGRREITFSTWYDKQGYDPVIETYNNGDSYTLTFPLSMDCVKEIGHWRHIRLDIAKYLHILEPDNTLLEINAFTFEGGEDFVDNIRLSSN